jgi:hypothetical protein
MAHREQVEKVEQMLKEVPKLDAKKQMKCMEMWKRLGPLSLDDICQHSELKLDFNPEEFEFREMVLNNGQLIQGQYSKTNSKLNGVARIIYPNNVIYEGQTKDDMPEGFGRVLDASGEYYIGQYRDTLRHGFGRFVTSGGVVQEGRWADDEFLGA